MAPEPNRGKRNDSGNIVYTLGAFAELMGVARDEAAEITAQNAERLLEYDRKE